MQEESDLGSDSVVELVQSAKNSKECTISGPKSELDIDLLGVASDIAQPQFPLTRRELHAWYAYDWANSVYSSTAIALFFPLLLVNLAESYAWEQEYKDQEQPEYCDALDSDEVRQDCLYCEAGEGTQIEDGPVYKGNMPNVRLPGGLDPVSFASTMASISVLSQAITFMSLGAYADYGSYRKRFLIVCTAIGSLATSFSIVLYKPSLYWLGGILVIVSNTAYGASIVFYNSYLPLLVESTPEVYAAKTNQSQEEWLSIRDATENRYSAFGFMYGYASGVLLTVFCLILFFITGMEQRLFFRVALLLTGIWWMVFALYTFAGLQVRPGLPAPKNASLLLEGWRNAYHTLKEIRQHKDLTIFLVNYFIYSDGYSTISSVGIYFAQRDICMDTMGLILIAVLAPLSAFVGNFLFLKLQTMLDIKSKNMLLLNLSILALLPLWATFGWFTPPGGIGLKNEWEMYVFAVLYGLNLGSVQSYSRTVFADLIPAGQEGQFFAIYEITDKGSSWMGPMVVAIIVQTTDSLRLTNLYLLATMILPGIVLYLYMDHERGTLAARAKISEAVDHELCT